MPIDKASDIIERTSTIVFMWRALKHKIMGEHFWIDNSWHYPSPSNGFHCGRRCLFCDKKIYALHEDGWFDEETNARI